MNADVTANSWVEVDLAAVGRNAEALRAAAPGAVLCGVVKKDAYGLGAVAVGRALEAAGAGMLAVYEAREACAVAEAGVSLPFLVLGGSVAAGDPWEGLARAGRLEFQVGDERLLDELQTQAGRLQQRIPVHLHADTGMSREGMPLAEAATVVRALQRGRWPGLRLAGLMTHLATADSDPGRAAGQVASFDGLLASLRGDGVRLDGVRIHVGNSYATLREPAWHRQMIRPGIALFGWAEPTLDTGHTPAHGWKAATRLEPVARWVSRIARVLEVAAGSPVGYGATECVQRDTRLGLVPVGYADGYPLALSGKGWVRAGGCACRVVGRVSMDQVMIDLTDAPAAGAGTTVEVYGRDATARNALPRMAAAAGTHVYELLTRIHPRVERRHLPARG